MKGVELYGRVRYAVQIEGLSHREAARRFGIDPRTVAKMMVFSVPPGYRRSKPPARPKLDPFIGIIDRILEEDKSRPAKQRHTSKRIFERLRDEHGYGGGLTIVKDHVHERRLRQREVFVPLRHDPGHAGDARHANGFDDRHDVAGKAVGFGDLHVATERSRVACIARIAEPCALRLALGEGADPFMLHLYAALAEKERRLIGERRRRARRR